MATTRTNRDTSAARKMSELLVLTKNDLGMLARITTPLAKNNINIECFTGYEWNGEAAFRFVTSNNRRARELLASEGYNVQENPVVLWQTGNEPGRLRTATTALAEAKVNTYCAYSTTLPDSQTTAIIFNTNDSDRTMNVLKTIR